MQSIRWADIPIETMSSRVTRQVVWGEHSTLARFCFTKGTHISAHKHDSEQHTCVLQGLVQVRTEGSSEVVVKAGEMLLIPAGHEHEVWVVEDSVVVDFFAPPRFDWRDGAHRYLTGDGE